MRALAPHAPVPREALEVLREHVPLPERYPVVRGLALGGEDDRLAHQRLDRLGPQAAEARDDLLVTLAELREVSLELRAHGLAADPLRRVRGRELGRGELQEPEDRALERLEVAVLPAVPRAERGEV